MVVLVAEGLSNTEEKFVARLGKVEHCPGDSTRPAAQAGQGPVRYLSGFVHALEPVPGLADFVVEMVSNAFGRLPDPVLLPWLPTLIGTLRSAAELAPLLIGEAGRIFPGRLSVLDEWIPPWRAEPEPDAGLLPLQLVGLAPAATSRRLLARYSVCTAYSTGDTSRAGHRRTRRDLARNGKAPPARAWMPGTLATANSEGPDRKRIFRHSIPNAPAYCAYELLRCLRDPLGAVEGYP